MAPFTKLITEFLMVLDNAVVEEGNRSGAVHVGMSIVFARRTVRGPAGVTNTRRTEGRGGRTGLHECRDGLRAGGGPGSPG